MRGVNRASPVLTRGARCVCAMTGKAGTDKISGISIAIPLALLVGLSAALAVETGFVSFDVAAFKLQEPESIVVAPRAFAYRDSAEYFRKGLALDAPLNEVDVRAPLQIMKFQTTRGEYRRCVDERECIPADEPEGGAAAEMPLTGVSYDDAVRYAAWLSKRTGRTWRLPTDFELAYAADDRFPDDALGVGDSEKNPAVRWLADYEREARRAASVNPRPQPRGSFGISKTGLVDFGGNIWEWTSTCNTRVDLDQGKAKEKPSSLDCGIFIASGKHRAPMSSFVRNPKGGGCSVGAPPDNLGFRLVRQPTLIERVADLAGEAAAGLIVRPKQAHMETGTNED